MSVIHCWTAADFSPTERALNSPSRTTLRLLQQPTDDVLTVVVWASRAASLVLDTWLQVARRPVADDDGNPTDDVIDFRSVGEAHCELRPVAMFVFTGSAATCHGGVIGWPSREIICFVTASNFCALDRSGTMAARIASHDRLVIVCKPQIETSKVSTLDTSEYENILQHLVSLRSLRE